jgi:hypothetical protein
MHGAVSRLARGLDQVFFTRICCAVSMVGWLPHRSNQHSANAWAPDIKKSGYMYQQNRRRHHRALASARRRKSGIWHGRVRSEIRGGIALKDNALSRGSVAKKSAAAPVYLRFLLRLRTREEKRPLRVCLSFSSCYLVRMTLSSTLGAPRCTAASASFAAVPSYIVRTASLLLLRAYQDGRTLHCIVLRAVGCCAKRACSANLCCAPGRRTAARLEGKKNAASFLSRRAWMPRLSAEARISRRRFV